MRVVFKLEVSQHEYFEYLQKEGLLPSKFFLNTGDTLDFEGPAEAMVKHLNTVRSLYRNDYSAILRPMKYEPDDPRLKWYEDLQTYLMERATWEEFSKEAVGRTIPPRFHYRRACLEEIRNNPDRKSVEIKFGEVVVEEVIRWVNSPQHEVKAAH